MAAEGGEGVPPNRLFAWAELIVGIGLTVTSLALAIFMSYLIGAGGIETAEDYLHLTPDFFPRLTMGILAVVSARYALGAARAVAGASGRENAENLEKLKRAGFMVVVAVCYASTVTWLGFILSTMLAALVVSYFLGLRKAWAFVPTVLIMPVVIRFVFERLLYISLPRSEIELVAAVEDAVIGGLVKILL